MLPSTGRQGREWVKRRGAGDVGHEQVGFVDWPGPLKWPSSQIVARSETDETGGPPV